MELLLGEIYPIHFLLYLIVLYLFDLFFDFLKMSNSSFVLKEVLKSEIYSLGHTFVKGVKSSAYKNFPSYFI